MLKLSAFTSNMNIYKNHFTNIFNIVVYLFNFFNKVSFLKMLFMRIFFNTKFFSSAWLE